MAGVATRPKVTVIGAGMVGGTVAQMLAVRDYADVVLVDIVEGMPQGKSLDLMQVGPLLGHMGEAKFGEDRVGLGPGDALVFATEGVTEVRDPAANVWTYEYDLLGNQIASHDPDSGTTRAEYDIAGQLLASTGADGRKVSIEYDALGRETAKWDGPAGTGEVLARWTYDTVSGGLGLPGLAGAYVDGKVMITQVNAYDSAGRPTTVTQWVPSIDGLEGVAGSYRLSQSFLPDGSVSHVNVPSVGGLPSESIAYEYDAMGEQTRLFGNLTGTPGAVDYVSSATFTAWGEIAQRVMGSQSGRRVYETQTYEDGTRRARQYRLSRDAVGATNVAHLSYDFDPSGNLRSIADAVTDDPGLSERQCFAYDRLRRLTDAWAQAGTGACVQTDALGAGDLGGPAPYWNSYTYDVTGNRTSATTRGMDGSERTSAYSYGAETHLLSGVANGSTTDTYSWDESGRLASRTTGGNTETFGWNAFGKLESITGSEGTTRMVYDADQDRVARIDADGSAALFVAGHEITVDKVGTVRAVRTYEHEGAVVATRSSDDGLTWIGRTHQGTAAWAIAASSMTVSYRRYDPFGNQRGSSIRAWTATQVGYHTGVEDPTGLVSMGARFYDPATGRFISRDPVIEFRSSQQANGYLYAGNNPMTWTDSSGLNWFTDKLKKAASVVKKRISNAVGWASQTYSRAKSWAKNTYSRAKSWAKNTYQRVKLGVSIMKSRIDNVVRTVAFVAGSKMYRKSGNVALWGALNGARANANGGKRSVSIPIRTSLPPKSIRLKIEYKVPTTAKQSKMLGDGYAKLANATGGSCAMSQGLNVCTDVGDKNGDPKISARGGTTIGDTFTSTRTSHSNVTIDHEKHHRDDQWRKYGVSFGVMYLWEEAASELLKFGLGKPQNCIYNRYEFDAENHGGKTGYQRC
jgi:RHS repeat-associated protein